MKRILLFCLLALAIPAPAALSAVSAPRAALRELTCRTALDPANRGASITAVMRPVAGTESMSLKVQLLRSAKLHGPYSAVKGHGLGSWIDPKNPTLGQRPGDVWLDTEKVDDLGAPAFYRFRVTFRWSGAGRRVLQRAVRQSAVCHQLELRPDLLVRSISVTPANVKAGVDQYVAVIANRGATGAGPFQVELYSGQGPAQSATVQWLGPYSETRERFTAPACTAGKRVIVVVDPQHVIDDSDPADNRLSVACPG